MNNAYASAAQRMHAHAEQTFVDVRRGTSDHLFGLAAECALKAILHAHGVIPAPPEMPPRGSTFRKFSTHINQLWGEYVAWAASLGTHQLPATSAFDSWNAEDRYRHDNYFTQPHVDAHRAGAATTAALLEQAIIEGFVK